MRVKINQAVVDERIELPRSIESSLRVCPKKQNVMSFCEKNIDQFLRHSLWYRPYAQGADNLGVVGLGKVVGLFGCLL